MSVITRSSHRLTGAVLMAMLLVPGLGAAGPREQAKRIHDRLAGVPPAADVLDAMEADVASGDALSAAETAMQNPAFYNVTLKNFATPWTNRDQAVHFPFNDYTATVIGMIRDGVDFRQLLYGDIVYVVEAPGVRPYDPGDNDNYADAERLGVDLSDPSVLVLRSQSALNPQLTPDTAAGVMTSHAGAAAFFYAGTNRAMFRYTMMNHLCHDLEQVKDATRPPDRVRQDVSRSPGGDSRVFLNNCVACHAGMDGLAGGYAYYHYETAEEDPVARLNSGRLVYTAGSVQEKFLINSDNFKYGYKTTDDSWINYWRKGPNSLLGWGDDYPAIEKDAKGHAVGRGAKSLGMELAHSRAYAECQVEKAFRTVCLRPPGNAADRAAVARIVDSFESHGYDMKRVFAEAAVYCMGD